MSFIVDLVGGMENFWLGVVGLCVNVTVFGVVVCWYRRIDKDWIPRGAL